MSRVAVSMFVVLLYVCHSALAQAQTLPSGRLSQAADTGRPAAGDNAEPQGVAAAPAAEASPDDSQAASDQKVEAAQTAEPEPPGAAAAAVPEYVGEMYKIGLGWHPAALQNVPKDKYGLADWVAMLDKGLISPQAYLDPNEPEDPPLDLEIVMPSNTNLLAGAHFPHSKHTAWLACESCHVKIFMPQIGANELTMSRIVKGEACGVCHGKVAFPLNHCERCHVPGPGAGKQTAANP